MEKIIQYVVITVLGLAFLASCKKNDLTPLVSVGTNTTYGSVDQGTLERDIYVSGLANKIHEVKVNFVGSSTYIADIELYLKSPSGKLIRLCGDENNAYYSPINVTFTDAASYNVSEWQTANNSSAYFKGTFKPNGSLVTGYAYKGTTKTLGAYKGDSPNGTWTLYVSDDLKGDALVFTSWELFLSTYN